MDRIRVLRVVEYEGPRDVVEEQIKRSIHGEITLRNGISIRAVTVGDFPSIFSGDGVASSRAQHIKTEHWSRREHDVPAVVSLEDDAVVLGGGG